MPEFELNNSQRACFGLCPVEPNWTRFYVKTSHYDNFTAIVYAENNTIKKMIRVSEKMYVEDEIDEAISPDHTILYPKTEKGKPVKLSAAVLLKRKSHGMCLSWYDKHVMLYSADNERNYYTNDYDGTVISGFSDFKKWVDAWCSDTTEEDLADLRVFAAAPRKHISYRAGDVFRFSVGRRLYGYGRILVDYPKMRKNKTPFWDIFMGTALECAVFPILTPRRDVTAEELRELPPLPSCIMADNRIWFGEYEIVGNLPISENEEYAIHYGKSISGPEQTLFRINFQYGPVFISRFGELPIPEGNDFSFNRVSFDLNVNKTILEEAINAGNNMPYWELAPAYVTQRDLRNPSFADQRKAVMLQMLGASNR